MLLKLQNYGNGKKDYWLPVDKEVVGGGGKWVWLYKDNIRDPCGDGNFPYLDCINAIILFMLLFYNLQDVTIGETDYRVHRMSIIFYHFM